MKLWDTLALLGSAFLLAAHAQHGDAAAGGRSATGGHSGPAGLVRAGGFAAQAQRAPGTANNSGLPPVPRFISPPPLNATGAPGAGASRSVYGAHPGYAGREARSRVGYAGYYPGFLSYGLPDYSNDGYFAGSLEASAAYSPDVVPPQAEYGPSAPYTGSPMPEQAAIEGSPLPYEALALEPRRAAPAAPAPPPAEEEDPVTIVFKDGRPSEQVRNYALTRTTLYVTGRHLREIPLDQIDLPATEKVNRAAGVPFQLPQTK